LAELAAVLPVQIIDPEVHRLIEEGPGRRRRYLDWGVFHVEHDFVPSWQRYQQVLKQRNAALKARQSSGLVGIWDAELVRLGNIIHEARVRYLAQLAPTAVDIAQRLLNLDLTIGYRAGWARDSSFAEALAASSSHDVEMGTTQVGPQRADLSLKLGGMPVKDRISRGQQKLLASTLLLAQLQLIVREHTVRPTLLLDDPAAELDGARLLGLIGEVAGQSVQLIVTSLTGDVGAFGSPGRRYRLDQGHLEPG
jgi:DNA replication and repair protein RecF